MVTDTYFVLDFKASYEEEELNVLFPMKHMAELVFVTVEHM